MKKTKRLTIAILLLIILAVVMIYLGLFGAPKILLPPVITGIGFFVIAWAIYALKK